MTLITTGDGRPLRRLAAHDGETFGFHRSFGFVSQHVASARQVVRRRTGVRHPATQRSPWLCRFRRLEGGAGWEALEGCRAEELARGRWRLATDMGDFELVDEATPAHAAAAAAGDPLVSPPKESPVLAIAATLGLMLLVAFLIWQAPGAVKPDEVDLKKLAEAQKTIVIPKVKVAEKPPEPPKTAPEKKEAAKIVQEKPKQNGAAVQNKLGFLSLLGKKDLKNAMGGMPTPSERKSPGAGLGGDKGSGGELLSGLGQGVKHTTVGNTGVAGLGGIGNAGAGGGAGGFGKSYVGSGGAGGGRTLANVSLAEDVELEGGLDRAVIQATIAKYLSQVRACYERGLRKSPGLTGQVLMDFEIDPSGKLTFAKVKKSSLGHDEVETCISKVMLAWQFPKPVGGTLVRVSYPFVLKPASYM